MTWVIPALSAWQLTPQAQYDRKYYWLKPVIGPCLGGTWQDSSGFLLEIKEYQSFNLKRCKNTEFLTCTHRHTHTQTRDSSKITLSSGGRDRGRWLTHIHLQSSPALEAAKWRFTKRENKWCIFNSDTFCHWSICNIRQLLMRGQSCPGVEKMEEGGRWRWKSRRCKERSEGKRWFWREHLSLLSDSAGVLLQIRSAEKSWGWIITSLGKICCSFRYRGKKRRDAKSDFQYAFKMELSSHLTCQK